jgi:FkbM family methyltransferase
VNRRLKDVIRRFLPRSIRAHRIVGGPLRGQKLVTSWHDYPAAITGRTERPLLEWFSKQVGAGETWLDIGAHYGYTVIALSRLVGSSGRVYAFEPMIASAGCISQASHMNRFMQLTVVPVALGNCEDLGVRHLPLERGMVDSTLGEHTCQEPFLVSRLDWLWPRINSGKHVIHGVKIDVQGMEIQVLKGMVDVLHQFKPTLAIELHDGVNRQEFLDQLKIAGYPEPGRPIEPVPGETDPRYLDNRSYAFFPPAQ